MKQTKEWGKYCCKKQFYAVSFLHIFYHSHLERLLRQFQDAKETISGSSWSVVDFRRRGKNRNPAKNTEKVARGEFIGKRRHEMNKVCKSGWKPKFGCAWGLCSQWAATRKLSVVTSRNSAIIHNLASFSLF